MILAPLPPQFIEVLRKGVVTGACWPYSAPQSELRATRIALTKHYGCEKAWFVYHVGVVQTQQYLSRDYHREYTTYTLTPYILEKALKAVEELFINHFHYYNPDDAQHGPLSWWEAWR